MNAVRVRIQIDIETVTKATLPADEWERIAWEFVGLDPEQVRDLKDCHNVRVEVSS